MKSAGIYDLRFGDGRKKMRTIRTESPHQAPYSHTHKAQEVPPD